MVLLLVLEPSLLSDRQFHLKLEIMGKKKMPSTLSILADSVTQMFYQFRPSLLKFIKCNTPPKKAKQQTNKTYNNKQTYQT